MRFAYSLVFFCIYSFGRRERTTAFLITPQADAHGTVSRVGVAVYRTLSAQYIIMEQLLKYYGTLPLDNVQIFPVHGAQGQEAKSATIFVNNNNNAVLECRKGMLSPRSSYSGKDYNIILLVARKSEYI